MSVVRTSFFQAFGQAVGASIARRQDNRMATMFWSVTGRPPCSCGRQYKRLGWYLRHLDRHECEAR